MAEIKGEGGATVLGPEEKRAHKPVKVEVIHRYGWTYRGTSYPHGSQITVPQYVLDGNQGFIKAAST